MSGIQTTSLAAWSIVLMSWCFQPVFAAAPVFDANDRFAAFEEKPLAHDDVNTQTTAENLDLMNKIQGLQQDIQELRGQLEVQMHTITALQQQQIDYYNDIDKRPKTQHTEVSPAQLPIDTSSSKSSSASEQVSYLSAYELINTKQYEAALPAMQTFVAQYPHGVYTANAHYWLGELYMVEKNYPTAIEQFELVLKEFPASNKSSASQLKIGYALAALGKIHEAKQHLNAVIQHYPDTHAALLAMTKLDAINTQ